MKSIPITLIVLLSCIGFAGGQITITASDMPDTGDTLRYSVPVPSSLAGYDFIPTGASYTWDFSNMFHDYQDVDTFVSVNSTPIFYYPTFLGNATIASKGESFNMASFSVTNVYEFFREASGYYAQVGLAAQFSGIPLPTMFSSPDYIYRFPLTYGDSDSCEFGYSISIPTLFSYTNQSKRHNTVDGWGTLTTPFGTFQTIRVKSVITSRDSVASDSLPFPVPPITTVTTEYKWLANGYRAPLLTAVTGGFGAFSVTYMDIFRAVSGVEGDKISDYSLNIFVYPNPSQGVIQVKPGNKSECRSLAYVLYDAAGRVMIQGTEAGDTGAFSLDMSDMSRGLYFLKLCTDDGSSGIAKVVRE